ncbi:MAG: hypothetical protein HOC23_21230 [Halieaceae bacterium]|nr:hypothetical protein [Halieaceae bacterium]
MPSRHPGHYLVRFLTKSAARGVGSGRRYKAGLKRTADVHPDDSVAHVTGSMLNRIIQGLLVLAVIGLLADRFLSGNGTEMEVTQPIAATDRNVETSSPAFPLELYTRTASGPVRLVYSIPMVGTSRSYLQHSRLTIPWSAKGTFSR